MDNNDNLIKKNILNKQRKTLTEYQVQQLKNLGFITNNIIDFSDFDLGLYWVKFNNIRAQRIDNSNQVTDHKIDNHSQVSSVINNNNQTTIEDINNSYQKAKEIYNGNQEAEIIHVEYQKGKIEG